MRYADDCYVFVRSARAGDRVMASITRFLEGRMRLPVNRKKSAVRHPSEVHFLGFRFLLREDGGIGVLLSQETERRLAATIREMTPTNWGRSLSSCMAGLSRYFNGWMAYFRLCTEEGVERLRVFDAHIRRRLRAIIVRQKKRPPLPSPTSLGNGGEPQGCRQRRVLRPGVSGTSPTVRA